MSLGAREEHGQQKGKATAGKGSSASGSSPKFSGDSENSSKKLLSPEREVSSSSIQLTRSMSASHIPVKKEIKHEKGHWKRRF